MMLIICLGSQYLVADRGRDIKSFVTYVLDTAYPHLCKLFSFFESFERWYNQIEVKSMSGQEERWLNITTLQDQADGYEVELNDVTGETRKLPLDKERLKYWTDSQLGFPDRD